MFATVIVVLPSAYTGGQVCVSHTSSAKILDMASSSGHSASILAWYTDVRHEVKHITSGYRLALSYNLVDSSPEVPRPSAADMDSAFASLRHVLRKWYKGAYKAKAGRDVLVYLLDHQYSSSNLSKGIKVLKGEDAHKVTGVRLVAENLGYMVCLASLLYVVTGVADNGDEFRWCRRQYNYEDSDEDEQYTPTMIETLDSDLKVSNVVDLDGNSLLGPNSLQISKDCLVPQDPFEDATPDGTETEAYMGNVSIPVSHASSSYIVLFPSQAAGTMDQCQCLPRHPPTSLLMRHNI